MKVEVTCPSCNTLYLIDVPAEGYKRWQQGELIQKALPILPPADRELLISGICGPCFEAMWADGDDHL